MILLGLEWTLDAFFDMVCWTNEFVDIACNLKF